MGYRDAEQMKRALDHVLPDHEPTCPRCGDLCPRLARICAGCGAQLYESLRAADRPVSVPRMTAPPREDMPPANGSAA
jgi:hypothetical protein